MRLSRLELIPYHLADKHGVHTSAARYTERSGTLLRFTDSDGVAGHGEASPLPGYSSDRLDLCTNSLRSLSS